VAPSRFSNWSAGQKWDGRAGTIELQLEVTKAIATIDGQNRAAPCGSPWCSEADYREKAAAAIEVMTNELQASPQHDEEGVIAMLNVGRGPLENQVL
jgi:hypothetical protein